MENTQPVRKQTEDFITILDLWHICVAHWNWFIVSLLLSLSVALYYLIVTPNQYVREAAILVKQDGQGQSQNTGSDNQLLGDVSLVQQRTHVPNVQRALVSLEVLKEVAHRLKMGDTDAKCLKVAQVLAKKLKVKLEDEKSSIINMSITDTSPIRAEQILSTAVQVFNEKWIDEKNRISDSTSDFISERLDLLEEELGGVDDSISSFKARNMITDIDRISDIYLQKQTQSEAQILTLSNQKSMAQYILGILRDKDTQHQLLPSNTGMNNSVAEAQISEYNTKLLLLKNSMHNTSTQNPLIVKQEEELEDIRNNIIAIVNNHVKALDIQLSSYINESSEAVSKITQNPVQAKHLLTVEREQKVKESLYLYLLQKYEENEMSTTYKSFITEMIDPPHGSDIPASPNSRNILFLAIFVGLVVPTVVLFVRENMDNTVRDKQDVERRTRLTLMGEVPMFKYDENTSRMVVAPKFEMTTFRDLMFWKKKKKRRIPIVVQPGKQDLVNEAFRLIRTNLEFMTTKPGEKNVYVVTSSYEGSGKTLVSMNISVALAIKGKTVLLIDGDLRHASASRYFRCPKVGFADYLAGNEEDFGNLIVSASDVLESELFERAESVSSLFILPVGTIPPNPTELLASERFSKMIESIRPSFDFIIIDCPPAEALADTEIIERHADRTLYIVRAGLFERKRLEDLENNVQLGKYKHLSLILNGTRLEDLRGYRYGRSRSSSYAYGYEEEMENTKRKSAIEQHSRTVFFIMLAVLICLCARLGIDRIEESKSRLERIENVDTTVTAEPADTAHVKLK